MHISLQLSFGSVDNLLSIVSSTQQGTNCALCYKWRMTKLSSLLEGSKYVHEVLCADRLPSNKQASESQR